MAKILMITKPLIPPWDDSAKNLARDIALSVTDQRFHILTAGDYTFGQSHIRENQFYSDPGSYQPPLWNNIKVFFRLLKPDEMALYHFFFAPNKKTSSMIKLALTLKTHQPTLQTVCSAPLSFEGSSRFLFADQTITVSQYTKNAFEADGATDIRCIYPAVPACECPRDEERKAVRRSFNLPENAVLALFAGDVEFSNAASTLVEALPEALRNTNLHVVFCNRIKTPEAETQLLLLKEQVSKLDTADRVHFVPAPPDIQPLLRSIDILLMHPDTLYAKMDLPLILLEAMAYGLPSIISSFPPLLEAYQNEEAGLVVPPGDATALAHAILELADDEGTRLRMGETARFVARTVFSFERLTTEYSEVYRQLTT